MGDHDCSSSSHDFSSHDFSHSHNDYSSSHSHSYDDHKSTTHHDDHKSNNHHDDKRKNDTTNDSTSEMFLMFLQTPNIAKKQNETVKCPQPIKRVTLNDYTMHTIAPLSTSTSSRPATKKQSFCEYIMSFLGH